MPITAHYITHGRYRYELGEPDRYHCGIPMWIISDMGTGFGDTDLHFLGLRRLHYSMSHLGYWYTLATWKILAAPLFWLSFGWPRWFFWRVVMREMCGRHLYLIDWNFMKEGYSFRWSHDFRPFRWARKAWGKWDYWTRPLPIEGGS